MVPIGYTVDRTRNEFNGMLDFSKIEAGKLALETLDFDWRTAVEDFFELLAETAHSKGLELACLVHTDVPCWVAGDPGRLRQILTNLVGNAVRFTDTGEVVGRSGPSHLQLLQGASASGRAS
jgi:two-component system sensor histidine kinase/response regulator